MFENIKTVFLWFLILTSITLTWLILTYQSVYDNLEDVDYIDSEEIGESRSISEAISPKQIVIHNEEDISWIQSIDGDYRVFMEFLSELEIESFVMRNSDNEPIEESFNGIELVFNEAIKHEWIDEIFSIDENTLPSELDQIDRMILLENHSSAGSVILQLISTEQKVIYHSNLASLSMAQLEEMYQESTDYEIPVEKRTFNEENSDTFQQINYVPKESFNLKKYTYETTDLPIASFIQALFTDPEYVDRSPLGSQTDSYTDGNRMMEIQDNGNLMKYVRPGVRGGSILNEVSVLEMSVDFINGHSGWTDDYYVSGLEHFLDDSELSFRLHIDAIPVLGSNTNTNRSSDYYTMRLGRSGDQISEYDRPLFKLDTQTFVEEMELPSFEEVEQQLEENGSYNLETVEEIRIGYFMTRNRSFVTFSPAWYGKVQSGRWTLLDMDREVSENGLE